MTADTTPVPIRGVLFHMIINYAKWTYFKKDGSSFVVGVIIKKEIIDYEWRGSLAEDGSADGGMIFNQAIAHY